jgi:hypothetical protein
MKKKKSEKKSITKCSKLVLVIIEISLNENAGFCRCSKKQNKFSKVKLTCKVCIMLAKLFQIFLLLFIFYFQCCLLQRRIFNGSNAKLNQFPYLVNVRAVFTCGGALLTER